MQMFPRTHCVGVFCGLGFGGPALRQLRPWLPHPMSSPIQVSSLGNSGNPRGGRWHTHSALLQLFISFVMLNLVIAIILDSFSTTVCCGVWWCASRC